MQASARLRSGPDRRLARARRRRARAGTAANALRARPALRRSRRGGVLGLPPSAARLRGSPIYGTGYPAEPSPQGESLTGSLGRATLNGTEVTVRRIEGVDLDSPSASRAAERGLPRRLGLSVRRVLEQAGLRRPAPLPPEPGLVHFDPPGGQVGETVVARSDRTLGSQVVGAGVSLVRLPIVADFVPEQGSALRPSVVSATRSRSRSRTYLPVSTRRSSPARAAARPQEARASSRPARSSSRRRQRPPGASGRVVRAPGCVRARGRARNRRLAPTATGTGRR